MILNENNAEEFYRGEASCRCSRPTHLLSYCYTVVLYRTRLVYDTILNISILKCHNSPSAAGIIPFLEIKDWGSWWFAFPIPYTRSSGWFSWFQTPNFFHDSELYHNPSGFHQCVVSTTMLIAFRKRQSNFSSNIFIQMKGMCLHCKQSENLCDYWWGWGDSGDLLWATYSPDSKRQA